MKKIFPILLFATSIFFFQSCLEGEEVEELIVQGMQPVYYSGDNINAISALPPQPITRLGKIYHKAPYIFMNDLQKGIHVVDNTDPANPVKVDAIPAVPPFIEYLMSAGLLVQEEQAATTTI